MTPRAEILLSKGVAVTLDERHRRILFAVVTEYIASGEPVGSRRIAKRYTMNLSPATIRNVLADLEESELLHQPHTSAGRVPTDAGFRFFVDAMATVGEISDAHRTALIERLRSLEPGADAVRETGQLLSHLTGTATLIARPSVADAHLNAFEEKQKLLERTLEANGVQVFIGSEAALSEVQDISVISSPYRRDGSSIGSFGIVGPTRMDYRKYVPLVGFAADVLSDVLDGRLPGTSKDS